MSVITEEAFEEWKSSPVTLKLMKMLKADREEMKEGLVYDTFDNPDEVKGRCRAVAIILDLSYEELMNG